MEKVPARNRNKKKKIYKLLPIGMAPHRKRAHTNTLRATTLTLAEAPCVVPQAWCTQLRQDGSLASQISGANNCSDSATVVLLPACRFCLPLLLAAFARSAAKWAKGKLATRKAAGWALVGAKIVPDSHTIGTQFGNIGAQ